MPAIKLNGLRDDAQTVRTASSFGIAGCDSKRRHRPSRMPAGGGSCRRDRRGRGLKFSARAVERERWPTQLAASTARRDALDRHEVVIWRDASPVAFPRSNRRQGRLAPRPGGSSRDSAIAWPKPFFRSA